MAETPLSPVEVVLVRVLTSAIVRQLQSQTDGGSYLPPPAGLCAAFTSARLTSR